MHHTYAVRDGGTVWTGSTNWTTDSWEREENVILVARGVPALAAAYARNFEVLWSTGDIEHSGEVDSPQVDLDGGVVVRAWFCPERGPDLSQRIATAIGAARRRVRIASPVITAGPILGTLAEVAAERRVDLLAVVDATQVAQVLEQWAAKPRSQWKIPSLQAILGSGVVGGKRSTPYRPGSVHDYMHAKVTVADDTVFGGSFNLSRSGEQNAENVLEIRDPALADRLAAFIESVHARYPDPVRSGTDA